MNPIGYFENENGKFIIQIEDRYISAMQGLEGFGYIQVIWWFDKCDNKSKTVLIEESPYKKGPKILGSFATRSPQRPNPIAVSTLNVIAYDLNQGVIEVDYTDAYNGTPILDVKPYTPSIDRIEKPIVPYWCSHWPKSYEESANFNWNEEFNF